MKLQPNKKYTTIAIYAFLVIAAAIALFYLINEHATVGRVIGTFVSLMMPFIYGAALAYILNPVLNWLEKKVFPRLFGERLSRRARRRIGVLISFIFAAAVVAIFLADSDSADCGEHQQPCAVDLRLFAAGTADAQ